MSYKYFNKSKSTSNATGSAKPSFNPVNGLNTYLGQKGYTIPKSELTVEQQNYIKEQLMARPYIPGSPIVVDKTFPVYRESVSKLYVPRYYGVKLLGPPKEYKLTEGEDIHLTFGGQLRDYQAPVVNMYLEHVQSKSLNNGRQSLGGCGLLELYCGWGKTDSTLYILAALGKKTLIIVHKEFLMTQWIERINKYFPNARIGKIQGQVIDIDNKDIVICMLQSLSMKDYPSSLFDSFGFTIIDEVHHISSEVFSQALFKLVTKYMLGLSATMNRKDGTTEVFKMFLGDVVYKAERPKDEEVIVRGIVYKTSDEEFNNVETDFRGNVAVSKMISKICTYNYRNEFILRVLKDMIEENPKQQIMLIAQYRNILEYMYNAISSRGIATVGYYVGGMKDTARKASESKQVVLGTYTMASEGLDIKTLTTLFMITPMTNIEQSVGRILREKHDFEPIVVDIIDSHDNFQRQWAKRKRFYKSQNYKIIQTDSLKYNPDTTLTTAWKTVYEPTIFQVPSASAISSSSEEDDEEGDECTESSKKAPTSLKANNVCLI
jgi:superfamily II DNA or RNA helicase